jgi:hypothetical protein
MDDAPQSMIMNRRGTAMAVMRWARLCVDLKLPMRRGAWYRIYDIGVLETVVEVNNSRLLLPSPFLQIVETPPRQWTVVPRPAGAIRIPARWTRYLVCPSCRERVLVERGPSVIQCPRCSGTFDVAWDEPYDFGL